MCYDRDMTTREDNLNGPISAQVQMDALDQFTELIEFAEGFRQQLLSRGWLETHAGASAANVLNHLVNSGFEAAKRGNFS